MDRSAFDLLGLECLCISLFPIKFLLISNKMVINVVAFTLITIFWVRLVVQRLGGL